VDTPPLLSHPPLPPTGIYIYYLTPDPISSNVRGEPVFSVVVAGWFCEKSGGIGKVEDAEPMLFF
jgi:hypothetical protein